MHNWLITTLVGDQLTQVKRLLHQHLYTSAVALSTCKSSCAASKTLLASKLLLAGMLLALLRCSWCYWPGYRAMCGCACRQQDKAVILASDGLWDVVSESDAVSVVSTLLGGGSTGELKEWLQHSCCHSGWLQPMPCWLQPMPH